MDRHPLAAHGDLPRQATILSERIKNWRDDDEAGYHEAIRLLCEAEVVLRKIGPVVSLPLGPFATIVADPPWKYSDKVHAARVRGVKVADYGFGADKIRGRRGAEGYYPVMDLKEIAALPVKEVAADNAHLYMWTTNAFIESAHEICRKWGFEPRTVLTWVKPGIGMGHFYRNNTEHVVFAVRGKLPPKRRNAPTAFHAKKAKQHSRKPDEFYALVESMSPGPYLEMFARRPWPGWTSWGNQLVSETSLEDAQASDAVDPQAGSTTS